jgi:hypothetical protein
VSPMAITLSVVIGRSTATFFRCGTVRTDIRGSGLYV